MIDPKERPFSVAWTMLSVVLFLGIELLIGTWIGPMVVGKYVSPMFHYQLQMIMHLLAFYLGGFAVGVVSPGRRLIEPAVGAFVSVLVVFLISFFMPTWFFTFNFIKVLVGGGIGFFLGLLGAWHGESWMGNIDPDAEAAKESTRGRLRAAMWAETDGYLSPRRPDRSR